MNIFCYAFTALVISTVSFTPCRAQSNPTQEPASLLEVQRKKIDSLDKELIDVLGARQRAVIEIGRYKALHNLPPLQPARFQEVVKKSVEAGAKEGLSATFITRLLNDIHEESLRIEDSLKAGIRR